MKHLPRCRRRTAALGRACALLLLLAAWAPARAQVAGDLQELLLRQLERTDAVLERVAPQVDEANRPRVQSLLQEAITLQKLARSLYDQLVADAELGLAARRTLGQRVLANTQRARDLALQAERRLREETGLEERARLQIERGRRLLDEARDRLEQPSDQQRHLLEEASRLLEAAERHYQDQSFEVALRLADSAGALLRGMMPGLGQVGPDPERLERELARTREWLDRAEQRRDQLDDPQRRRLEEAVHLQQRAEDALRARRPMLALEQTLEARALLRDLLAGGDERITVDDVTLAIERFDAKLAQLRADGEADWPPPVRKLVDDAGGARARALELLARDNPTGALAQVRLGLDMLGRASRELERARP